MPKKSQFQNLVLQQTLQDCVQQPTIVQPAITLPINQEALVPLPPAMPFFSQTLPAGPGIEAPVQRPGGMLLSASNTSKEMHTPILSGPLLPLPRSRKKMHILRGAALLLSALLILAIYLTWHAATPTAASPTVTQQASGNLSSIPSPQPVSSATTMANNDNSTIQVYIVGAVKHPGVYTLATDARVYQLIQAAGGTQPDADLVSINLAAKLADGQEIYVLSVGETPPAYTNNQSGNPGSTGTPAPAGSLVNINTATETAMMQALHVSSTTAQKIIAYRTQHGAYTSTDQLLQVVSQSIYDHIKNLVKV